MAGRVVSICQAGRILASVPQKMPVGVYDSASPNSIIMSPIFPQALCLCILKVSCIWTAHSSFRLSSRMWERILARIRVEEGKLALRVPVYCTNCYAVPPCYSFTATRLLLFLCISPYHVSFLLVVNTCAPLTAWPVSPPRQETFS